MSSILDSSAFTAAAEYAPSPQVLRCHNIPRLDATLARSSYDSWAVDSSSFKGYDGDIGTILKTNTLYFQSLYTLPLIIFCFTVVAVLAWMITRYCVRRCGPQEQDYINKPNKVVTRRKVNVALFGLSIVLSIVAANYLWKSDADIKSATQLIVTAGRDVRLLCSSALDSFVVITQDAADIDALLSSSNCSMGASAAASKSSVLAGLQDVQAGLAVPHEYLRTIPAAMGSFEAVFDIIYQHDYVYLVYAFFFAVSLLFVAGYFYQNKTVMAGAAFVTCFVVISCAALSAAVMVWAQGLADFCMAPTANLVGIAPAGDTRAFLQYVATCTSPNPMAPSVQAFQTGFVTAESPLLDLQTQCSTQVPSEAAQWQAAVASLAEISAASSSIAESTSCETLNLVYDLIVNDTTCTTGFYGIYQLFLNGFTLSGVFFLLVLLVGYQWEFYKFGWHLQYGDLGVDVNNPDDAYLDGDSAELRMTAFRQGRGRNHNLRAAARNPVLGAGQAQSAEAANKWGGNGQPDAIPGSGAKAAYTANAGRWGFGRGSVSSNADRGSAVVAAESVPAAAADATAYEPPL